MIRVGQGYDIHQLIENKPLILGGVQIPFEKGLKGHSDADVLIHSIIDSLFGALNLGDIGEHFPDTDIKYKGISSIKLLKETKEIISKKGYEIVNIDSTIICEKPKLSNYKKQIAKNIAQALEINNEYISIKAKTKEKMDSTGRGEAIEAMSICLVKKV